MIALDRAPRPPREVRRWRALSGIAGPAAFTVAWLVSGWRQPGYPVAHEHISGLAALDAAHAEVMIAGFVTLGVGTSIFATELHRALGGRGRAGVAPWLLGAAGAATVAAGLLRRDAVLLHPPDRAAGWVQSWHNDGHDLAAGVAYASTVLVPVLLAARCAGDPRWARWRRPALAAAALEVVLLAVFASDVDRRGNGLLQRVVVTLPQVLLAVLAWRLLRRDRAHHGRRRKSGTRRSRSARTPSA